MGYLRHGYFPFPWAKGAAHKGTAFIRLPSALRTRCENLAPGCDSFGAQNVGSKCTRLTPKILHKDTACGALLFSPSEQRVASLRGHDISFTIVNVSTMGSETYSGHLRAMLEVVFAATLSSSTVLPLGIYRTPGDVLINCWTRFPVAEAC